MVQDSLHGKRLSALKQEKFNVDYEKGKTPNSHKIQKLQMSNVKQVSNMVSLSNQTSTEHSKQSYYPPNSMPTTEFSQYCDSLNIRKNKNFIQNGGQILKKNQIEFASEEV